MSIRNCRLTDERREAFEMYGVSASDLVGILPVFVPRNGYLTDSELLADMRRENESLRRRLAAAQRRGARR